jgi:tripeptide aminopeptidase
MIQRQRLIDRFIRYARVGTTANPSATTYPSSSGQLELERMIADELKAMGASDVEQDQYGLVWATIPGSHPNGPTILLNSHLDTSPEAPGHNCSPHVIESYPGGPIVLLNGTTIDATNTPELSDLVGQTLITTDGTTLLGGDDKAGVAVIMEVAQCLLESPDRKHAALRILFTCDEEIGAGTKHLSLAQCRSQFGYTLDGGGAGCIDVETFSANKAVVSFRGRNTHPSVGKGRMINSIRAASEFVARLPRQSLSPESTDDRQGFLHPYHLAGTVDQSEVHLILRDFETERLDDHGQLLDQLAKQIEADFPGLSVHVEISRQYRNMGDVLKRHIPVIEKAERAFEALGRSSRREIIRGGTDGALMSEMGLPTPNLSVGQYNIHSVREFVSVNQMIEAGEHALKLLELWIAN